MGTSTARSETEQQREGPQYNTQDTPGSKLGPKPKEVGATLTKVSGTRTKTIVIDTFLEALNQPLPKRDVG